MPDLTISIVTHNSKEVVGQALRSLLEHTEGIDYQVVICDNASSDGTPEVIARDFPQVDIIRGPRNLGFAAANNTVIRATASEYLLLLNPDTQILDGSVPRLMDYLATHPDVAAVGPRMEDGRARVLATAHSFATWKSVVFATFRFDELVPARLRRSLARTVGREAAMHVSAAASETSHEVDWLCGACLMVRRSALGQVGLLDERFFMFMEDEEWCLRMRQAGWRVCYLPSCRVRHLVGHRARKSLRAIQAHYESSYLYHREHNPRSFWLIRLLLLSQVVRGSAGAVWARVRGETDSPALRDELGLRWRLARNITRSDWDCACRPASSMGTGRGEDGASP